MNVIAALFGLVSIVLGASIGIFLIVALSSIINGFVLTKLWLWFMVPFFGFAPLNIPLAIGIGLIATFLTHHTIGLKSEDDADKQKKNITLGFLRPFVYLLVGWVVHAFFMPDNMTPMFNPAHIVQTAPAAAPAVEASK